jgi:hypothetical protein
MADVPKAHTLKEAAAWIDRLVRARAVRSTSDWPMPVCFNPILRMAH